MSILVVAPVGGCLIHSPPPNYVLDNGLWVDKAKPWVATSQVHTMVII